MTKNLQLTEHEFALVIDALINRKEDMQDVLPFSVSPLAVKLRIKELDKLIEQLRGIRDVAKIQ